MLLGALPLAAHGQHVIEARGADTHYRYADWSYTWGGGAVADVFYVGVPGSNEFNAGGGYAIKRGGLLVSPLAYVVIGKEDSQRGIKVALLVAFEGGGWKLQSFVGHYVPVSGGVGSYDVLDVLDLTRTLGTRVEAGVETGFFHVGDAWNQQTGPVLKLNDSHGAWAVSYRFGSENEFRVGRVLTF
jgi:hypothetical protein